jgi:hypothetical protein
MADLAGSEIAAIDWEEAKRQFGHHAMQEALAFMRLDNQIVASFAAITDTLAQSLKDNPRVVQELARGDRSVTVEAQAAVAANGESFFQCLKNFILGDKDFIIQILEKILKL